MKNRGDGMRLIDVDALKREYNMADVCENCKTDARECQMQDVYTKMAFCGWLEDAPTIDAIPMWWITEKFLDVLNKDEELSKAVWLVRKAWQKEQEGLDV